ncbi:carboxypeptidase-like regulatory domain-containing protein [Winogradskyella sp. E313]|nr:carboxypeptidase-like regulatory domain-containing protein [Winogradskyella immobilis]
MPFANAQQIVISGKVTDTLKNPLVYANVLAIPQNDNESVRFAVTEKNGSYKLGLEQNQTYEITVSYLGFVSQKDTITTTDKKQSITKHFVLKENIDQLETIELNYTPPVSIKKDTITYAVDAFATGNERKLREILKKLPGIEVDREGNVFSQGRRVTKVLVEGKVFFTGNSKLAVNNIPADAVDKIQVLDNYNDVPLLKGLQDTEDLALNIKLKEDKKQFAFGDIEVGVGIEERYLIHPNLFYYSPKTNLNFIGDLNNTGIKSFVFTDYLEFEGGTNRLLNDTGSYFNLFNSDFAQFLNNRDFTANTNQFGAFNIRQSINNKLDISSYVITSNSKTGTERSALNTFLNTNNTFTETRSTTNSLNTFFTIGKLTIDYDPNNSVDIGFNSSVKATNNDNNGLINTINPNFNNSIATITDVTNINLKQELRITAKLTKKHTGTLEATHNYQNDEPITNWITNQQILQGLIPLEDDTIFNILQTKTVNSHTFNAVAKDYWTVGNFNHIYTSIGVNTLASNFFSSDAQQLSNGSINNFNSAGFGNDFSYNFFNAFAGIEYKFQIGKTEFKPAGYFHYYNWDTQQFNERFSNSKALFLPQFTSKTEFNNSEKLNFRYRVNASFSSIDRLANNFILSSFNRVFRGNTALENQLSHNFSLSYYKFSLYRGLNFNLSTSYNRRAKSFKNVTQLDGIEQFSTPILFEEPEQNISFNGRLTKKVNKFRYTVQGRFSYSDFFQILNNETNLNISKTTSGTLKVETLFKKAPNLEVGYTKDFNSFRSVNTINRFENDRLFTNLEYRFFKDVVLKADYALDVFNNEGANVRNTFDTANLSLFYQKEDSPWGFELNATNLFDVRFRQQSSFNAFLISDNRTFILPRIILLKLSYKL